MSCSFVVKLASNQQRSNAFRISQRIIYVITVLAEVLSTMGLESLKSERICLIVLS